MITILLYTGLYILGLHTVRYLMHQEYPLVSGKCGSFLHGLLCCFFFLFSWHTVYFPLLFTLCYFLYDTIASLLYFKTGLTNDIALHHLLGGFLCAVALLFKSYEQTSNVYDITCALLRMEITNVPLQGYQVIHFVLKQEHMTLTPLAKVFCFTAILGSWCKFRLWDLAGAIQLTTQVEGKGWEVFCALGMGCILFVQQVYWLSLLLNAAAK